MPDAEPTREEIVRVLEQAEEALARCYNVTEWPADGSSDQDAALASTRDILARLQSASQGPGEAKAEAGYTLVPTAALKWLNGEGPDHERMWFGDGVAPSARTYWWRRRFAEVCEAFAAPLSDPQPKPEGES